MLISTSAINMLSHKLKAVYVGNGIVVGWSSHLLVVTKFTKDDKLPKVLGMFKTDTLFTGSDIRPGAMVHSFQPVMDHDRTIKMYNTSLHRVDTENTDSSIVISFYDDADPGNILGINVLASTGEAIKDLLTSCWVCDQTGYTALVAFDTYDRLMLSKNLNEIQSLNSHGIYAKYTPSDTDN